MITISEKKLFDLMVNMYLNASKYPNPHVAMDAATKEIQLVKRCLIGDVVKPLTAGRHRWKNHGRNRKKCVKCGCLKDITASQSFHTYLQKGGEWSFSRPVCDG